MILCNNVKCDQLGGLAPFKAGNSKIELVEKMSVTWDVFSIMN